MALPLTQRPFDLVCAIYFLTHIPITIFVDSQSRAYTAICANFSLLPPGSLP